MNLPIELVPNTSPPKFRWRQVVDGRTIEHEATIWPSVEGAVKDLIEMAQRLIVENAGLRGKLAVQTELLKEKDRNVPTSSLRKAKV